MASHTRSADWKTAPTHHVEAAGTRFAYRRLGPDAGVPVVLLNHWGANLDNFDPRIVEGLAADRPVYALDYRGIGASGGTAPLSVPEMASDTIAAIRALDLKSVDPIGFWLGGSSRSKSSSIRPISSAAPSLPAPARQVDPGLNGSVPYRGRSSSKAS